MIRLPEQALAGSYPPLVTPFSDGKVDYSAYERLIEHQVAGGSQGVVVTGTSGEPSLLTVDERAQLVRVAARAAAGRVTVVAATGCGTYEETCLLSQRAEAEGADALLVVTPYYLRPPQRGMVEYFVDLAGRTGLPVLIYHIPGRAAVTMEPATLEAIASRADNV
ncbi:MAG TPA: dihydrodipicolinate synthase family protein, partial [Acidimicrobiales bacterium]|nr:dihydrodipicolinate synthase family protein [Acidimicrobiales bacterium]